MYAIGKRGYSNDYKRIKIYFGIIIKLMCEGLGGGFVMY